MDLERFQQKKERKERKPKITKGKSGVVRVPQIPLPLKKTPDVYTLSTLVEQTKQMVCFAGLDNSALYKIAPYLEDLNNMVGLSDLKKTIMEQVLYYLQGFHQRSRDKDYLHTLILGPPGTGKCLAKGTEVIMASGRRERVENIEAGDLLLGDDGNNRTCSGTVKGTSLMYKVHQEYGLPYTVNDQHILCLCQIKNPIFSYEPDLDSYRLLWWDKTGNKSLIFSHTEFVQKRTEYISLLLSLPRIGTIIEITVDDYIKQPASWKEVFKGYKCPIDFYEHSADIDMYELGYQIGAARKSARLPEIYLCNSVNKRRDLLNGILKRIAYSLPLEGRQIWEIVGLHPEDKLYKDLAFLVCSVGMKWYHKSKESIYIDESRDHIANQLCYEIRIERLGMGEYYGFSLDGNGRFLLGDCTVTHNTSVAQILSKIYSNMNIIQGKSNGFKIAHRDDFVAGYLGQTSIKTQKLLKSALGGVLFIDEFYSLGPGQEDKDSFSKEALDTLCSFLSEHSDDFCCIAAGYEDEVRKCVFAANRGLESRFQWKHNIQPYTPEELTQIFIRALEEQNWDFMDVSPSLSVNKTTFSDKLTQILSDYKQRFQSSGRDVLNYLQKCKIAHSKRVFGKTSAVKFLLIEDDLREGLRLYLESSPREVTDEIPYGIYC